MYDPKTVNVNIPSRELYEDIYARSVNDPEGFWKEQSEFLDWYYEPYGVMDHDFDAVGDSSWGPVALEPFRFEEATYLLVRPLIVEPDARYPADASYVLSSRAGRSEDPLAWATAADERCVFFTLPEGSAGS